MRTILSGVLMLMLAAGPSLADTVATVGAHSISRDELEQHVRPELVEIELQRFETLQEGLDELIADELLRQEAKARGVTPEALEQKEITAKVTPPTDAEVQKLYDDNKERLGNPPLATVKSRIVDHLKRLNEEKRRQEFLQELRGKYKTVVLLEAPRINVGTGGRPSRGGGPNAPVTIIAFSDYECPYCKRAEQTVDEVLKTYGDKVRVVHRDFPLSFHEHAHTAAEAAHCAEAQGKFWEYHRKLFASSDLSTEQLQTLAVETGLDADKFKTCLATQQFKAAVDKDAADGSSAGVSGTPSFFINGHMLSGAQPFENFKKLIDQELARAKGAKPS